MPKLQDDGRTDLEKKAESDRKYDRRRRGAPKWLSDLFTGDLSGERWLPVPGFEGLYEVSSMGRIKSLGGRVRCRWDRIMRTSKSTTRGKYDQVTLSKDGKKNRLSVHRLVCWAFHGAPPSPIHHAAHSDGSKKNNREDNLSWKTPSENQHDRKRHGTACLGEENRLSKLKADDVLAIRRKLAGGVSVHRLSSEFDVTESTIKRIRARQAWAHLQ